jgi:hypothetical protein
VTAALLPTLVSFSLQRRNAIGPAFRHLFRKAGPMRVGLALAPSYVV